MHLDVYGEPCTAKTGDGGRSGLGVNLLRLIQIPSSYLWGEDSRRDTPSPEESVTSDTQGAAETEESDYGSVTEPKHKKAKTAADDASVSSLTATGSSIVA